MLKQSGLVIKSKSPSNIQVATCSGWTISFLHDFGQVITNLGLKFFLCKTDPLVNYFKELLLGRAHKNHNEIFWNNPVGPHSSTATPTSTSVLYRGRGGGRCQLSWLWRRTPGPFSMEYAWNWSPSRLPTSSPSARLWLCACASADFEGEKPFALLSMAWDWSPVLSHSEEAQRRSKVCSSEWGVRAGKGYSPTWPPSGPKWDQEVKLPRYDS